VKNESPVVRTIKRQETWRQNYHQRRYLQHATGDELTQRLRDLLDNVCDFTAEGKLAMKLPGDGSEWVEYFTHLLEELGLRGTGITPEMRGDIRLLRYPSGRRAAQLWNGCDLAPGTYLLKYSKLKYLRPLLNVGSLRIAPAGFYSDPSLNPSVRDSELEFTEELHGARVHYPPNGNYHIPRDQWIEMPVIGNVKSTKRSDSDYYIACFSSSYEYRLYDDFEAEGCLVIKDVARFANNLKDRMGEALPGWSFLSRGIEYRDPYHPKPQLDVFFCKHFRYAEAHPSRIGSPKRLLPVARIVTRAACS
jgi:hypothetical protein